MSSADFDQFDVLLAKALQSKPEPSSSIDLAAEAMRRVQLLQAGEMRLQRIAFWRRASTLAAAMAIAAILIVGYLKFPSSTATDATTVETATTATSTFDLTTLGVTVLALTLIGIVLATLLSSERPQLRLSPA